MSQVLQPTKYIKEAQHKKVQMKTAACQCESETKSDDSIFVTERVGVVNSNAGRSSFMAPLMFHTGYTT